MAGLLDFLQPQSGGLLGGVSPWMESNRDALMMMGLGLAGGQTSAEGLQGALKGLMAGRKSDNERVTGQAFMKDMGNMFGAPEAPAMAPGGGQYAPAIAGIESGGRYDAVGPETGKGRAYGKYQVMDFNIGPWTKEVLGQEMTPQQFAASPQAQDAVFNAKFGQYASKYGPEGAARAWFAGEEGMNDPNRKDILGTTVAQYGQKFAQAMPQGQPQGQPNPLARASLPQLMKWAVNPNLPAPQREVVKTFLAAKLDESKLTDTQKNYMAAKAEGYKGSFVDFKNAPTFGVVGTDEFGRDVRGWINPNNQTTISQSGDRSKAPIELVTKLRTEVQALPSYKSLSQAAPVYKSMLDAAGRDTRGSDVNMIYGMAKIMDPTSVVRESEMTIAQAVATLPQHLQATVMSQLNSTGRLSPQVREQIMQEAYSRVTAYKQMFDQDAGQYRGLTERYRMNADDVLPQFGEFKAWEAPKRPSGISFEEYQKLPSGSQYTAPDGNIRRKP